MERAIVIPQEQVQATRDGRKTEARMLLPASAYRFASDVSRWSYDDGHGLWIPLSDRGVVSAKPVRCRWGVPGDRLWMRESCIRYTGCGTPTHWPGAWVVRPPGVNGTASWLSPLVGYEETYRLLRESAAAEILRAACMPRWAAQTMLQIVDVPVERLHAITTDAIAREGFMSDYTNPTMGMRHGAAMSMVYQAAWNRRAPTGARWPANPWVFVVRFRGVA